METLTADDVATLTDTLHELARVLDQESFHAVLLEQLGHLIGFDMASVDELTPGMPMVQSATAEVDVAQDRRDWFTSHLAQHPMIGHFLATGDTAPHRFGDFLSDRELHALPIYNEVFRHAGVERQAGFPATPSRTPPFMGVTVNRASGRDFSRRDLAILGLLQPMVVVTRELLAIREQHVEPAEPTLPDLVAHGLSRREAEVMVLVVRGLSTAAIARELYVTVATVRKHLERIYGRLGVHSRAEATAMVTRGVR